MRLAKGDNVPLILIVEDNADILDSLRMVLEIWGHEVTSADSGQQGLDLIRRTHPDVALIDIGLPGMSGYELARRLRALRPKQGLRIVAITGWGQEVDRQQSREAGFDIHLVKPVELDDLQSALAGRTGSTLH